MDKYRDAAVTPALLQRALDVVSSAVLLIGPNHELLWANREGRNLLEREDGFSQRAIEQALTGVDSKDARGAFSTVPRPSGKRPFQMAVVPVPPSSLIFVHDPELRRRCCTESLRKAYGFTKSEAAVAACIANGQNLAEIATELGISMNTVRAHLKRLFAKTRTSRQAELALLLGAGIVPTTSRN